MRSELFFLPSNQKTVMSKLKVENFLCFYLYVYFLVRGSVTNNSYSYKIFSWYKNTHSHTFIHTPTLTHTQIDKQEQTNRLNKWNTFPTEGNPQTHTSNWHVSLCEYLMWLMRSNCTVTDFTLLFLPAL